MERLTLGPEEATELAAIARRHYVDGVSRVEIAKERGLSRFKVGRLLQTAHEAGIVRIEIRTPGDIDVALSESLRQAFGLRRALVVRTADPDRVREPLGQVCAELLREIVTSEDVLGFDCGRTLRAMTGHLRGLAGCDVVQLTGMGGELGETAGDIARVVGEVNGGRVFPIYAPLVVPDARTAQVLRSQRTIKSTTSAWQRVTIAVVAIGAWSRELSQTPALIGPAETARLARAGVVGETAALLMDADGRRIPALDDRRIAIAERDLRAVPDRIGVAGGTGKAEAIRSMLRSGLLTSLVTDEHVARRLVES
ncbi:sugar-binding transcriptional regulator [Kineococcus gynurae]|uniref:Sugar-binding transcriptional regulator n=1 Tax=Kineococcus gynurae TaxID=452979 RepID=A0ABV5LVG8_9ACTN